MSRIRQINPNNYSNSGRISAEFESVIRYINAAELGDKTIGELLSVLFDEDGQFDGPIEFRFDSESGLEYRVGTYSLSSDGWKQLVPLSELRGPSGLNVGTIGAPILHSAQTTSPANGVTVIDYAFTDDDDLMVYVDGVLQTEGASNDYTKSSASNEVTFTSAFAGTETVTIYKVRATSITNYNRQDFVTVASQSVFPFVHDEATVLQVYKNGILQRAGGAYDYTTNPATDTVTFTSVIPAGNTVSIITVENTALSHVTGLMNESDYTDLATGLIKYAMLSIADGDIDPAKVDGLNAHIASSAKLTVSGMTPASPQTGDLWLDTSVAPNVLKFYTGTQWLQTSPESGLPTFAVSDAGRVVKVNNTGTALVYGDIDFSSLIPVTQKGAASGVASLDGQGRLPEAQLPEALSSGSLYLARAGAVADGNYDIQRIFKQKISIIGVSVQSSSGTATAQITVGGVNVGPTFAVSSTPNEQVLGTAQEIDSSISSKLIGVNITGGASLADLEVTLAYSILSN